MDASELRRLTGHYTNLTDAELVAANSAGAEAYRDREIWCIIVEEHAQRSRSPTFPQQPGKPSPTAWLLISKLKNASAWDSQSALPFNFLYFTIALSVLGLLTELIGAVREPAPYPIAVFIAHLAILALFVLAVDRRTAWGWHYLCGFYVFSLLMSAQRTIANPMLFDVRTAMIAVLLSCGVLIGLYLARRRPQFGLPTWQAIM